MGCKDKNQGWLHSRGDMEIHVADMSKSERCEGHIAGKCGGSEGLNLVLPDSKAQTQLIFFIWDILLVESTIQV